MARSDYPPLIERRSTFIHSWRRFALGQTFGGMTLEEFEAETQAMIAVRQKIMTARTELSGLMLDRANADDAAREAFIRMANGVRASSDYGYDCPMYRALGYVPKSESKTGRRRRKVIVAAAPEPPVAGAAD
jgi:hypothetical protein